MAKLFSVASWNVEHFKGDRTRIQRVIDFLHAQSPDVFALYEVEGAEVFASMVATMPDYTFQVTEGAQTQEILIGLRRTVTGFITQKTEFKSGTTHMRPGQLVAITVAGKHYGLLFLHLASGSDPRGMGLRDDMGERAFEFRKVLDKAMGGPGKAQYMFLGDLNTMGMTYPFGKGIDSATELRKWDKYAGRKSIGMRRLANSRPASWSNGSQSSYPPSSLDHVFASTNLRFATFTGASGGPAEVDVRGWAELATQSEQDQWIARHSDHALLYFEVHD